LKSQSFGIQGAVFELLEAKYHHEKIAIASQTPRTCILQHLEQFSAGRNEYVPAAEINSSPAITDNGSPYLVKESRKFSDTVVLYILDNCKASE
jgi:hypothetical protein